jgi:hypothetical protein
VIDVCAKIMQVSDRLIAEIRALPNEYTPEQAATLNTLEQGRQLAFERMRVFNTAQYVRCIRLGRRTGALLVQVTG